jgi:hypothetical protein
VICGHAEFQPGQEQADDCDVGEMAHTPGTTTASDDKADEQTAEGSYEIWGLAQKGLLLVIIVGCVALYLRLTRGKSVKDQGYEKSLA